jgi:hypothetical protein
VSGIVLLGCEEIETGFLFMDLLNFLKIHMLIFNNKLKGNLINWPSSILN